MGEIVIIVEDGTGYNNSNSFVTVEQTIAYAAERGVNIGNDQNKIAVMLIKAKDYLEAQRSKYMGLKYILGQALTWPRYDVKIDGDYLDPNVIPSELKKAQMQLVIELFNGIDIMPTILSGSFVKSEKIGPIETTYSESLNASGSPTLTAVDALLEPLFKPSTVNRLSVIRV